MPDAPPSTLNWRPAAGLVLGGCLAGLAPWSLYLLFRVGPETDGGHLAWTLPYVASAAGGVLVACRLAPPRSMGHCLLYGLGTPAVAFAALLAANIAARAFTRRTLEVTRPDGRARFVTDYPDVVDVMKTHFVFMVIALPFSLGLGTLLAIWWSRRKGIRPDVPTPPPTPQYDVATESGPATPKQP